MLVAGMGLLYKILAVIRAMAEGVYHIPLHMLGRLLMPLGILLALLVADEEFVLCHGFHKALQRFAVHHVMAQEINNEISGVTNAWVMALFIKTGDNDKWLRY